MLFFIRVRVISMVLVREARGLDIRYCIETSTTYTRVSESSTKEEHVLLLQLHFKKQKGNRFAEIGRRNSINHRRIVPTFLHPSRQSDYPFSSKCAIIIISSFIPLSKRSKYNNGGAGERRREKAGRGSRLCPPCTTERR